MLPAPSTAGTLTAAIGLLRRILAGAGAGARRGDRLGSTVGAEKLLEEVCGVSSGGVPECARWACWWARVSPWAQPRGRGDLEMSLAASPSCAPASGGFDVTFPPRPSPIFSSQRGCAGLLPGYGSSEVPRVWRKRRLGAAVLLAATFAAPCCAAPMLYSGSSGGSGGSLGCE